MAKFTTEKLEKSRMSVQVDVEPDDIEKFLQRAYRRLVNRTLIPGFRKGKAPRPILERYLGKEALLHEAIEILIPETYDEALKSETIPAIGQPEIELLTTEPNVSYKATVAVEPTVTLGDYKALSFKWEQPEATQEKIDEVLEQLRAGYAPWEPVERPVEYKDMVSIAVYSTVETDEGPKPFIERDSVDYGVDEDDPDPVPGFAAALVGMNKGEEKEFTLDVPADYADPTLAGKPLKFKVTVLEIKAKKVAELDDEFAKSVGEGYDSLAKLKEQIGKDLRGRGEREAREALQLQVIDGLVEQTEIEYPEMLVEHEIEHLIQQDSNVPRDQQGRVDEYLKAVGQTPEEFMEGYREEATKRVLRSLALEKVEEAENITVSPEEIDEEIEGMTGNAGEQKQMLLGWFNTPERRSSIQDSIRRRKTVNLLLSLTTDIPKEVLESQGKPPAATATEAEAEVLEEAEDSPTTEAATAEEPAAEQTTTEEPTTEKAKTK